MDIGEKYTFGIEPDRPQDEIYRIPPKVVPHHAFMLCHEIPWFNEAAIYYKKTNCLGETINMEKTLVYHKSMEIDEKFFK